VLGHANRAGLSLNKKHGTGAARVRLAAVDVRDYARLRKGLAKFKPHLIFHLAGMHFIPDCEKDPALTLRVNVEGTLNLLRAAATSGQAKALVFASSAAVYAPDDAFHSEADIPRPCEIYGLSKLMAEQLIRMMAPPANLSYVIARIFNPYGPGKATPYLISRIASQVRASSGVVRLGALDRFRDFIHVEDVAEGLYRMGKLATSSRKCADVMNLATGREHSVREVLQVLGEIAGNKIRVVQRREQLRTTDRRHLRANIQHMRRRLRWRPRVRLRDGLENLLAGQGT
ncbi:MAG: NAD-dependent epimerase/dehydratase family protein, partial [Gammaproteobacteria bacterium]